MSCDLGIQQHECREAATRERVSGLEMGVGTLAVSHVLTSIRLVVNACRCKGRVVSCCGQASRSK